MKISRLSIFPPLYFLFVMNICLSQTKEIDSIKNLLVTAKDTTQVNLLRKLGKEYRFQDKEKALTYALEGLEKSREINFIKGEVEALYDIGLTHGMTGSYTESLDYLNQCLLLAKQTDNFRYIILTYNSLGILYKSIGDYPTSHGYYLKILKLSDSLDLSFNTSAAYTNLGNLYDLMGEPDKAVNSYKKSLEVYTGPDPEKNENIILANLAVLDFNKGEYQTALDKFLRRQSFAEKINDKMAMCIGYYNIGICHLNLGQWNASDTNFNKALELAEQLSLEQQIPIIYNGLSDLMFKQKRYEEAIQYSNKNLEVLSGLIGSYAQKHDAHQKAYEIYHAIGQFPEAIEHLNQSMVYKDSLLNETKVKEIQNLQVQHDVYLKDNEIKANKLELALLNTRVELDKKRMVYLGIIAVLLLLSASLLYFRYRNKQKSNALLREKNALISEQKEVIEQMNIELEKRMLRAQMNPHFIFNSLGSIQHLINSNDRKGALIYLSKFSKLLRQVLESSINIRLPLKEEIELLRIYIELEALRFDNSFKYTLDIDKNLDIYNNEIPMLLVQPYIENAIIHGLLPKEGQKELKITFNNTEENIICTIEDNGVGLSSKKADKTSNRPSRGMSITEKRIKALKKLFPNQDLITIENLNDKGGTGTRVTILIPKN